MVSHSCDQGPRYVLVLAAKLQGQTLHCFADYEQLMLYRRLSPRIFEKGLVCLATHESDNKSIRLLNIAEKSLIAIHAYAPDSA